MRGFNAPPTKIVLAGKEYILTVNGPYGHNKYGPGKERIVLIEPKAGTLLWECKDVGYNPAAPVISGKILMCSAVTLGDRQDPGKLAGYRVSLKGAKKIWERPGRYASHRHVPVAHHGRFYIDPRTHFSAIDPESGEELGKHPHIYDMSGGDHNWTWIIASDGKLVTKGCLYFSQIQDGFKRLPGRIGLQNAGGYWCPVKPAMADGRLFYFSATGYLVCYDLRTR